MKKRSFVGSLLVFAALVFAGESIASKAAIESALQAEFLGFTGPVAPTMVWSKTATAIHNGVVVGSTGATATTGQIGEVRRIDRRFSNALGLTSNVAATGATTAFITLDQGDWQVSGSATFIFGATTSLTRLDYFAITGGISVPSTEAYTPNSAGNGHFRAALNYAAMVPVNPITVSLPPYQVIVPAGTTLDLYAGVRCIFTVSTCSESSWLEARRMR